MRFVTVRDHDRSVVAILGGGTVRRIEGVATLIEYLRLTPAERAQLVIADPQTLDGVTFDAPVRPHKNIFCVGRNYADHAAEVARAHQRSAPLPAVPTFFTKAPTAIAAPDEVLQLSARVSQEYDWEAELGVVIGRRCRDLSEAEALSAVFGYTCVNDVTARNLQREHGQWFKGKSLDHTCPLGPSIVTADELRDGGGLDIALRVNGVTKQRSNTSKMIFGVAALLSSLSRGLTLEPGDVIATGTPKGVGFARTPPEFLRSGDVMEVEIGGIGVLRNPVRIA
ncbi:MAG: fumarylacetoacetate hydrolase family protein [Candidatus Eremiobacteraeota bacterium]|nr:fumarylacetoacetate hydrolase family protein [Candidatus Eremiobacteraeota bacterium]